ncbi:MAG: ABC transporter permease [Candidatus Electrothrix scaldis]|nr:MAG: ABC transporter permease [Candidatus Electrothrix sp. GW3-3]
MFLTYVREAVRSLYTAKQRTLLALIGISIAIGAVIALVSIGIIWGEEMMKKYSDLNPDVLDVWEHWEEKSRNGITVEDTLSLLDNTRTLANVVPVISGHVDFFFNGQRGTTSLKGTIATYQKMNNLSLQFGRFISDLDSNKNYAVIGPEVLNEPGFNTFKGDLVGSSVKLNNMSYTIIGVLEDRKFDWETRRSIIIPISTASRLLGVKKVSHILARMQSGVDYQVATKDIEKYFKSQKDIEVIVRANEQWLKKRREDAQMHTMLLGFISSISLLIGGVGIMNVMLTSVIDRRREIGILRAIGARQRDIRRQFLTEAVILSLIGGVLGAGIGVLACYIVCSVNEWTFFVPKIGLWLGLGVSSLVGIFFGFYPAHKAAKLDPITALRSE